MGWVSIWGKRRVKSTRRKFEAGGWKGKREAAAARGARGLAVCVWWAARAAAELNNESALDRSISLDCRPVGARCRERHAITRYYYFSAFKTSSNDRWTTCS